MKKVKPEITAASWPGEPLVLRSFPNGGWVVTRGPVDIGAYGSARKMLDALSCLVSKDQTLL